MTRVDITSEARYKFGRKRIRAVVEKTVSQQGVRGEVEVSVAVVGERKMTELHRKYMGEEGPTDVLSWPLEGGTCPDGVRYLGDVAVCYPVAVAQAREAGRPVDEEICNLVEHGCRHLLGLHHE